MKTRRAFRRTHNSPIRRVCLDLHHVDPDRPCPYCDPDPLADDVIVRAVARHAEIAAEDAEAWGWVA